MRIEVPFNRPFFTGREFKFLHQAVRRHHLSSDGKFTEKCQKWIERFVGPSRVLLTNSGTAALEMAAILTKKSVGDEVILPAFTFPSTANAFVLQGFKLRFVDIREDTLNMDENRIMRLITSKTRVVCPVHYAGTPCEMKPLMALAKKHHLFVVEDAAQAFGAEYRGVKAGTFGDVNAVSFHETKNVSCGEGGAVIVRNKKLIKRAEIIRQKGTNRVEFLRGNINKYSWVDIGSSFAMSDLQAAFLYAQLLKFKMIQKKRREIYRKYHRELRSLENRGDIRLPVIPRHTQTSYHLFYLIANSEKERSRLIKRLEKNNIHAVFHYYPLHLSKMGRRFGYKAGDLPVTERMSARLVRLPFFNTMKPSEQNHVIRSVIDFYR